jgi:hypothetical protein
LHEKSQPWSTGLTFGSAYFGLVHSKSVTIRAICG